MNFPRDILRKWRLCLCGGCLIAIVGVLYFSIGLNPSEKFEWLTLEQRIKMIWPSKLQFAKMAIENWFPKMSRPLHNSFWKPVLIKSWVFEAAPDLNERLHVQTAVTGTNGTRAWVLSSKDFDMCTNAITRDKGVVIWARPLAFLTSSMPGVVIDYPNNSKGALPSPFTNLPEHQIFIYMEIKPELGLRSTTLIGGFMAGDRIDVDEGFTEITRLNEDFRTSLKKGDALLVDTNLKRVGCTNDTWFLLTPDSSPSLGSVRQ